MKRLREALADALFFRLRLMCLALCFSLKLRQPGFRLLCGLVRKTNRLIQRSSPARQACLLKKFDSCNVDRAIAGSAARLMERGDFGYERSDRSVCFFSSEIYDSGGHSALIARLVDVFNDRDIHYVESNCFRREQSPSLRHTRYLEQRTRYCRMAPGAGGYEDEAAALYAALAATKAGVVLVFIHMDDVAAATALAMLARTRRAEIIFVPHADHLACLGFSFADAFICARSVSLDRLARFGKRLIQLPLPARRDEPDGASRQGSELIRGRYALGDRDLVSLTGTPAYKIFQDTNLAYFNVIKHILSAEPNLKHFFIADLSRKEERKIAALFRGRPDLLDRIFFVKPTNDFESYIQSAHIYIDTMPMGSALTLIDLISFGCPPVTRVCADNPLLSFADYLYDGYEYLCRTDEEMVEKTLYLLRHPDERRAVAEKLKGFYRRQYDTARVHGLWREAVRPAGAAGSAGCGIDRMAGAS